MNRKIRDALRYIVKKYPYENDLSKTRITKLVFLADWLMAQQHDKQITDIKWFFDHYGPYVSDVLDEADKDKKIRIKESISAYGSTKYLVEAKGEKELLETSSLTDEEKSTLDNVIESTKELTWNDFINYVYNTEPIKNSNKYDYLDLIKHSKELEGN